MFNWFKKKAQCKLRDNKLKDSIGENIILTDKKLFQVDVNDKGRLYTVIRVGDNIQQIKQRMSKDYKFEGYSFDVHEIQYPEGYVVKMYAREGIQYRN